MTESPSPRPHLPELESAFEILRELGGGGTSVVYLARDRDLGREVALKVLRPGYATDAEALARLQREARLVSKLRHPNIVRLLGTLRLAEGGLALVMEYVPGATLKQAIREGGPAPFGAVRRVLRDMGLALDYAHWQHGVVHRDLKPGNIHLDPEQGHAVLSDFGIARAAGAAADITISGATLGTPAYMSPEQVDGRELDGRSDLYSLGLVAYEMLTGEPPWAGHTLYNIIYKQKHEELPPLGHLRPDTPSDLIQVLDGLLRKDRDERWRDAAEFLEVLDAPGAGAGEEGWPGPAAGAAPAPDPEEDAPTVRMPPGGEEPEGFAGPSSPPGAGGREAPSPAASAGARPDFQLDFDDEEPAAAGPFGAYGAAGAGGREPTWPTEPFRRPGRRRRTVWAAVAVLSVLAVSAVALARMSGGEGAGPLGVPEAGPEGGPGVGAPGAGDLAPPGPAGPPARIVVLDGDGQAAPAGQPLLAPLLVRVEDEEGRPVEGTEVTFEVEEGGGSAEPPGGVTDAAGVAGAVFVLGSEVGEHVVTARLPGGGAEPLSFRATALPRGAASLAPAGPASSEAAPAEEGPREVAVRVEDELGNPVPGEEVHFVPAPGGSADPVAAVTGPDGVARSLWTPGTGEGEGTLLAEAPMAGLSLTLTAGPEPGPAEVAGAGEEPRAAAAPDPVPVGPASAPGLLSAGGTHTCRVGPGDVVRCWGAGESGQLGDGSAGSRSRPGEVAASVAFSRVSAGVSHTCALGPGGQAYCWGEGSGGQLGGGAAEARGEPAPVAGDVRFTSLAAGLAHTCGLASGGTVHCWGSGENGRLGDGSGQSRASPAPVSGSLSFASLTAGWTHTCALTSGGAAYCWGGNSHGQVGDGTADDWDVPVAVAGSHTFRQLAAGATHTCGVTDQGRVLCWGRNAAGQLGDGTTQNRLRPTPVARDEAFALVTAGATHTCALTSEGEAFCWGRNSFGQLGTGSTADAAVPVRVEGDLRFRVLDATGSHTCGLTAEGAEYCWGYNVEGQLGDGTRTHRTRPVRVGGS